MQSQLSCRVQWLPEFEATARLEYWAERILTEAEPIEVKLERTYWPCVRHDDATKVVKIETAQVRQTLRMKIQAPEVEVVTKVFAKEKKNAEPITEYKKAKQKNDE